MRVTNFFGIIFYIIIIGIFINAKKTAQGEHSQGKSSKKIETSNSRTNKKIVLPNAPVIKGITDSSTLPKKKGEEHFHLTQKENMKQSNRRKYKLWDEDEYAAQRIVALRLMEGDTVPENYKSVKCPYCGADNLVVKGSKQYHSCYFCRVGID